MTICTAILDLFRPGTLVTVANDNGDILHTGKITCTPSVLLDKKIIRIEGLGSLGDIILTVPK